MQNMFVAASAFNQDLSAWNVSSVTTLSGMFSNGASVFNQNLSAWNVSRVTDMRMMFYNAYAFNQDLSAWDVSSVTSTMLMFRNAMAFNQNLCAWASKSPQLRSSVTAMFPTDFCNGPTTPVLRSGTPSDPHIGPFCFTC
eukprot:scaffold350205_cov35-Attheya_sp.AAC.2